MAKHTVTYGGDAPTWLTILQNGAVLLFILPIMLLFCFGSWLKGLCNRPLGKPDPGDDWKHWYEV